MNGLFDSVESVAHVIQVALTPVFLFSGVASLLGVLSQRLGRVADRVDLIDERLQLARGRERRRLRELLRYLRRRSRILDFAVMLAVLAGAATCAAALLLFFFSLRGSSGAVALLAAFGLALALTIGALACYLIEMLLASRGIRLQAHRADEPDPPEPADEDEAALETHADPPPVAPS